MVWWDCRKSGNPEGVVPLDQSHIDPVYKTIWLNAKAGTEFFTASTDGTVSSDSTFVHFLSFDFGQFAMQLHLAKRCIFPSREVDLNHAHW